MPAVPKRVRATILFSMAVVFAIGLLALIAAIRLLLTPHFMSMYADYGAPLPKLTVFAAGNVPSLVSLGLAAAGVALAERGRRRESPALTGTGLFVVVLTASALLGLTMWAMYLPIFEIAEAYGAG